MSLSRLWLLPLLATGCWVSSDRLDERLDGDGDGFIAREAGGNDCDDTNGEIRPDQRERCGDSVDNDCDGEVDDDGEGAVTFYADVDGDGFGDQGQSLLACSAPVGFVPLAGDCDDDDSTRHPDAVDVCNQLDDDCDGPVDEDAPLALLFADVDGDGRGDPDRELFTCNLAEPGFVANSGDCEDGNPEINDLVPERCDGIDQDCDGLIDDDLPFFRFYVDADADGFGDDDNDAFVESCEPALAGRAPSQGDCDDSDPTVRPDAVDFCDGLDQDCDGQPDDDVLLTLYYPDDDFDGAGDPSRSIVSCGNEEGFILIGGDCDDTNPLVGPQQVETCNGIDDDCDDLVDNGLPFSPHYADVDGDSFGDETTEAAPSCELPVGRVRVAGDCDDTLASVSPVAEDTCDDIDTDCDGDIDDDVPFRIWFADNDGDGFGVAGSTIETCDVVPPAAYADQPGDCDDEDTTVNFVSWYRDNDDDGFGDLATRTVQCEQPPGLWQLRSGDCDDTLDTTHPFASELCGNNEDDDCDSRTDCLWSGTSFLDEADWVIAKPVGATVHWMPSPSQDASSGRWMVEGSTETRLLDVTFDIPDLASGTPLPRPCTPYATPHVRERGPQQFDITCLSPGFVDVFVQAIPTPFTTLQTGSPNIPTHWTSTGGDGSTPGMFWYQSDPETVSGFSILPGTHSTPDATMRLQVDGMASAPDVLGPVALMLSADRLSGTPNGARGAITPGDGGFTLINVDLPNGLRSTTAVGDVAALVVDHPPDGMTLASTDVAPSPRTLGTPIGRAFRFADDAVDLLTPIPALQPDFSHAWSLQDSAVPSRIGIHNGDQDLFSTEVDAWFIDRIAQPVRLTAAADVNGDGYTDLVFETESNLFVFLRTLN